MNKYKLFIFAFVVIGIFCFTLQTAGFDLYGHTIITYFYDSDENIDTNNVIFNIVLPRYLILSNIYKITRLIGVPTGVVIIILWSAPVVNYLYARKSHVIKFNTQLYCVFALFVATRYCAIYLSLLYLISALRDGRKFAYLGCFFHPFAPILYGIAILFKRENFYKNIKGIIFAFILFCISSFILYDSNLLALPLSQSYRFSIDARTTLELLFYVLEVKSEYVFYLIYGILFIYFFNRIKKKSLTLETSIVVSLMYFLTILLYTIFSSEASMLFVFDGPQNPVFNISFFDWFGRDYSGSFSDLMYLKRLHVE
tara:strand:- start:21505 stop:22440 length:936 start_codon:yes stop_codon:yes gene_type:complete